MTKRNKIENPAVAAVFDRYPQALRGKLLLLRRLILDVAAQTPGVGELEETLKWGQPAYLTTKSKSGSLVRIDQIKSQRGKYAMYFHCQTTLVDSFRAMYRDEFEFDGNRSIVFDVDDELPETELSCCIALALTYQLRKKPVH